MQRREVEASCRVGGVHRAHPKEFPQEDARNELSSREERRLRLPRQGSEGATRNLQEAFAPGQIGSCHLTLWASKPVSFPWNPPSLGGVVAVQHIAVRSGAMLFPWYSTMMLTVESSCVIGLRVTKMARGGLEAYNEAVLMVSEK